MTPVSFIGTDVCSVCFSKYFRQFSVHHIYSVIIGCVISTLKISSETSFINFEHYIYF